MLPRPVNAILFEKKRERKRMLATLAATVVLAASTVADTPIPVQEPSVEVVDDHHEYHEPFVWRIDPASIPNLFRKQRSLSDTPEEQIATDDLSFLALTMWAEARGEGETGMRAVGHVIKNRADSGRTRTFGTGIRGVVTKPHQFTCWSAGDPNRGRMQRVNSLAEGRDKNMWTAAQQIAGEILNGRSVDPTRNAVFYHTTSVRPGWAARVTRVATIGSHIFYR